MFHPLSWFTSREEKTIYRNNKPVAIRNKRDANYYFGLQEDGYVFADELKNTRIMAVQPRITIGGSVCTACEG